MALLMIVAENIKGIVIDNVQVRWWVVWDQINKVVWE